MARGHGVAGEGSCCGGDIWNNGQYARGSEDLQLDITEEGEDEEEDDDEEDEEEDEGTSVSGFSQGHRVSTDGRPESQLTSMESQSPCPGFDAREQQLDERTATVHPPGFSTLLPNSIMSMRSQMTSPSSAILDYMSRRRTSPPPPLSQPVIGGRSASHLMAVIMAEDSWRMSLLAANKRI